MSNLQMSLKKKWFDMTDAGIKTEDYRDINEYWVRRLFNYKEKHTIHKNDKNVDLMDFLDIIYGYKNFIPIETVCQLAALYGFSLKKFEINTMTLGYPKSTDTDRIRKYKHAGIEIRTGNPEWGAEPNKLYFVIKHGEPIQ